MRKVYFTFFIIFFCFGFALADETLFDKPVEFSFEKSCPLSEFCEKYINDIDIEEFIKKEIENDYVVVSLDECIDVALKNNFDTAIEEHNYRSSKYEYENALSKFLPILHATAYIADNRGQMLVGRILRETFHETAVSMNITAEHDLTQGGRLVFEAKAKKYFSKAQRHNFHFTRSEALYYTAKYYYEMLLAKVNIEIYLRNLIERNAQLKLAQNLLNSGFGTEFDVIRSENESAQAKISLLGALNQFRKSQVQLANVMGIKVDTALMPFESNVSVLNLFNEDITVQEIFNLALDFREDLKAYEDLILYEKQIKYMYVTDFIPKPLVSYQEQFQGTLGHSVEPNYIITGYVTWQPGENLVWGTIAKIKAQKEKIKARKLEFQNKLRDIEGSIVKAYFDSMFNKKEIGIAKSRVDYSNESVKLAMLRFNHGKGILLDVIQAQSEMTKARAEYVNAVIKYNISQLDLVFGAGVINSDIINKNYNP